MLEQLCMLRDFETRSVCSENKTGEKGMGGRTSAKDGVAARAARDLGDGWKTNPYERIAPGETREIMNVAGEGMIRHIWMTPAGSWRDAILRFYWDGSETPSVECPIGDFFACGWGSYAPIRSLAICVNPGSAFNCYWSMPFRKGCRVTVENRADEEFVLYYQITYEVRPIPAECAYFHAQFRRVNPLPYKQVYTILDGVKGKGHYVGTYMAWGVNNNGWWGEGEIKFYLDGDDAYPTICGTGTEDYFCGSYNFEDPVRHDRYETFTSPYSGLAQATVPNALYQSQMRFGLYRWHINDPIYFQSDLRVTIQALGWRSGGRYLPLQDDIASVAYWYQTLPCQPFPPLGSRDDLEII